MMMQFDRAKLRAAILHTCRKTDPDKLGAVKLHKVLYFLDMIHYAQAGSPVTGATYRKRPYGPTCVQLLPTLKEMAAEGALEIREVDFFGLRKMEYHAQERERPGLLNEAELALLDEVIKFVCERNSAKTISEYSHKLPWEMVEFGDVIPYHTALLLFPSEPTPEALELAEQEAEKVETERSSTDPMGYSTLSSLRSRMLSQIGQG